MNEPRLTTTPCRQHRLLPRIFITLVCLNLTACDALFDMAVDCIDSDGPVFNRSTLTNPVLNQEYRQIIQASIENDPRDDYFDYRFEFSGTLPAGLSTEAFGRDFTIIGTATELGSYDFRLRVEIDDPSINNYSSSGLCRFSEEASFQIRVEPM